MSKWYFRGLGLAMLAGLAVPFGVMPAVATQPGVILAQVDPARCAGLEREQRELRGRIDHENNPAERAGLTRQLDELRHEQERCR